MKNKFLSLIGSLIALSLGSIAFAGNVSMKEILNDQDTPGDVLSYGLGPKAQRYSGIDQLNKKNIKNLYPAWSFSFGGEKQRGQESQALVHKGTVYVTGSYSRIWAIDLETGEEKWQWDARLPTGIVPCCDVVNRGAAIYKDKVIFGTLDARIVALNKETGKVVWNKKIANYKDGYSYTAAPIVAKGMVITGNSGGEFGIIGQVDARDIETGEIVWTRPVIEGHYGTLKGKQSTMTGKRNATWKGDTWKTGGGATWNGGTYDPELNLVYFGTSNPAPWNSHLRPGDNLYTSSRLALDVDTGEIKWHFQTTPHDGWDYDGVNEFVPFDMGGEKLGATADRNGFFYVLNRENGKFVRGFPFVKNITWAKGLNADGSPIYIPENRPGNPGKNKKGSQVFAVPSFLGGKNWMPMSYSQKTEHFYVPSNEWGMDIWNEPITYKKGAAFLGAGFTIKPIFDDYIGSLKAINPKTGKTKWEYKNPAPLWGGILTTAGGLVFAGTPEGFLKAFDDETGEELWKFQTGSGVVSSPITFTHKGEQYVGVASGWGGAVPLWGGEVAKYVSYLNQGGSYWLFKLPSALK